MANNRWAIGWIIALALLPGLAVGQVLGDNAFNIQYGAGGITSLRRANDTYETEYVTRGGVLGNVVIQYRKGADPGWTTAREIGAGSAAAPGSNTVNYLIGTLLPTLPQLSTASASANGTSLTALSDGQFPPVAVPGAPGGRGERGSTQWVQYTFPGAQEVSTVQVYWASEDTPNPTVRVPASWRLLYQDGSNWNEVKATTPYGVEPGQFNRVDFAPVKTTALRAEVRMATGVGAAINEWRVGPERIVGAMKDIKAEESFKLNGDFLDWTGSPGSPVRARHDRVPAILWGRPDAVSSSSS